MNNSIPITTIYNQTTSINAIPYQQVSPPTGHPHQKATVDPQTAKLLLKEMLKAISASSFYRPFC